MSTRNRFALVGLLALLVIGLQAGSAGAGESSTWHPFHIHVNAYGGSGSCNADWHHASGKCTGLMEEGTFLNHRYPTATHAVKVTLIVPSLFSTTV